MPDTTSKHIVIDARIRRASTGRYVDRLLEHLQAIDTTNRYTILLQPDDTWQPTNPNFTTEACKYAQFSLNPFEQFGFASQLRKLKADLVHFPMNQQPLLYRGKVVTTTMDFTMLRFTRPKETPLPIHWLKMLGYRLLFWYSNKKSQAIITISNYVKNELEETYSFTIGKVTTTYCATETPLDVEAEAPAFAKNPEIQTKNFLLYVGSAFPHKNLETLIKAFEIIHTSQSELLLVLVGKKEYYYEQLEKLASQSPAREQIVFTGFVSDAELKWLYQNARAYVFPSLSEGFGLPGLEAMVHGCPVVSSNATCLPEVQGDAAAYFDPNNSQEMADTILEVIGSEERRSDLVKKGYEQAKKFSWRQMAQQTLEIYTKVLTNN
jgi:glycosyltransferase involved in cell wall biosynthesis